MSVEACTIAAHFRGITNVLSDTLREELPEIDAERLRAAVERIAARLELAGAPPDDAPERDWAAVVDAQLERLADADEGAARAEILRELAGDFEHAIGDLERAMAARLDAFAEAPAAVDLDPLLRLARASDRWRELPLDAMSACAADDADADAGARAHWLVEIAGAWERLGAAFRAADCYERA